MKGGTGLMKPPYCPREGREQGIEAGREGWGVRGDNGVLKNGVFGLFISPKWKWTEDK